MKERNWKKALLRLYYVAWGLYVLMFVAVAANGRFRDSTDVMIWLGLMLLPPPTILWATRWIYAGFYDKEPEVSAQETKFDSLRKTR